MLDNVKNWLSQKINQYLHSEDFIDWAQQKAAPKIKDDLEAFIQQPGVKEKINEYQQNPELLEKDFLTATGYLNTVDAIFTIIDIVSIVAIVLTFLESFGASAAAGAGFRTFVQQVAKQGVKQVGKAIIKRALTKVSVSVLKRYAVIGATRFSAGLLKELGWRVAVHSAIMGILRGLEVGGVGALLAGKDAIRKYGADLGMPEGIISQVTQPDVDAKTFKYILEKYAGDIEGYTLNLVTSKTGLTHLTMGALARSLGLNQIARYKRFSDAYHGSYAAAKAGTLTASSYAKDFGLREKYHRANDLIDEARSEGQQMLSDRAKGNRKDKGAISTTNDFITNALMKSTIPDELRARYKRALLDMAYGKKPQEVKQLVEEKIGSADRIVANLEELLREMAILDLMQKYEKILLLPRNHDQLQQLLEDVSNVDTTTLNSFMKKMGVAKLSDLAKVLRSKKAEEMVGQLDSLSLGQDELDSVRDAIAKKINLGAFKKSIEEDITAYEQDKVSKSATKH